MFWIKGKKVTKKPQNGGSKCQMHPSYFLILWGKRNKTWCTHVKELQNSVDFKQVWNHNRRKQERTNEGRQRKVYLKHYFTHKVKTKTTHKTEPAKSPNFPIYYHLSLIWKNVTTNNISLKPFQEHQNCNFPQKLNPSFFGWQA